MNSLLTTFIKTKDFPLFFKVLALACCLMFIISVYAFLVESFREARVFLYNGLIGFLIVSLLITWIIGLSPSLLIRFVFIRKPISKKILCFFHFNIA